MPQIGATRDQPHPGLRGYRFKATQSDPKTLILWIMRPFSDVKAVDE
jgi:hypothetical protein